eukprot:358523-Chlamydomonas_euryale.AAC.2
MVTRLHSLYSTVIPLHSLYSIVPSSPLPLFHGHSSPRASRHPLSTLHPNLCFGGAQDAPAIPCIPPSVSCPALPALHPFPCFNGARDAPPILCHPPFHAPPSLHCILSLASTAHEMPLPFYATPHFMPRPPCTALPAHCILTFAS